MLSVNFNSVVKKKISREECLMPRFYAFIHICRLLKDGENMTILNVGEIEPQGEGGNRLLGTR